MRVLAIRGSDIASLAGSFEVDFEAEPLAGARLFAITGPTGSGKSTLLDVLCLALFGETPRVSKAGNTDVLVTPGQEGDGHVLTAKDPRNLLRRGAAQGRAEADFLGVDGQRYRATWSVRRARLKPTGALQKAESQLARLVDDVVLSEGSSAQVRKDVEAILGLSFDQFGKAVLLAQGDFAAFLKAKAKDRSDLLEKITGGEIYAEISRRAFEKKKGVEEEIRVLQGEVNRLRPMDDEERKATEERLDEIRGRVGGLTLRKTQAEAAGRSIAGSRGFVEEAEKAAKAAKGAEEQAAKAVEEAGGAAAVETREGEAASLAVRALDDRRPELEEARRLDLVLGQKLGELKDAREAAAAARETAGEERAKATGLEAGLERSTGDERTASEWIASNGRAKSLAASWEAIDGAFSRLASASSDLLAAGRKATGARRELAELAGEFEDGRKAVEELDGQVAGAASKLEEARGAAAAVDRTALLGERTAVAAESAALSKLHGIARQAASARRRAEEAERKAAEYARRAIEELGKKEAAESRATELAAALSEAQRERDAARDVRTLAEYRPQLVPGQPCPLCGSKEHPWIADAPKAQEPDELDRKIERIDAGLGAARGEASRYGTLAAKSLEEKALREADAKSARAELGEESLSWEETGRAAKATGSLRTLLEAGPDSDDVPAALDERISRTKAAMEALVAREAEANRLEKARDEAQADYDALAVALDDARRKSEGRAASLGKKREDCAALDGLLEAAGRRRAETLDELRRYAASDAEAALLEESPDATRESWLGSVDLYRAKERLRSEAAEERTRLTTALAGAKASAEAAERSANEKARREETVLGEANGLSGERARLLGGKGVDEVKKALEEAVRAASESFSRARTAHHEAVVAKVAAATEAEGARAAAAAATAKAASALEERAQALALAGLAGAADPEKAVAVVLGEIDASLEEEGAKQRQADAAILADDRTRTDLEKAREELGAAEESGKVWISLSKLIGTQDGAAFRTFAQGITLRTLLRGANGNLNELAPRYQLRPVRGSDMDLLVVDRDMGDEARSVESLSGGESFLVSLALALGLASLASKRTTIGSLFIDEGFGSLDSDTLDKAISVLDGIQKRGRRVGIISHVSALRDRIGVRVHVSPLGNGRSKVRVISS